MKAALPLNRIALIGAGLLGSSIAHAARRYGAAKTIAVYDKDPAVKERVAALGLADEIAASAAAAVREADLVLFCIPVGAYEDVAKKIALALKPGAIVSDVGSVKETVARIMATHLPRTIHLIPGHPVAGTEYSGPDAGFAELFQNRWCILTPAPEADPKAIATLTAFWEGFGAHVEQMDAKHHDKVLAITSHIPHLIAYNIVGTAADLEQVAQSEVIKFSAGGFRDFTRIASSDPVMWRDIFLNNREAVLEMLGRFSEDLTALQRAIRWGDGTTLFEHFSRTRAIRREIVAAGQETAAPDFGRSPVSDKSQ